MDITTELNVNCEVFQFYPIMKYLPKKEAFPLKNILHFIQPYISYKIDPAIAEGISSIIFNSQQYNPQGQSQVNPGPYNPNSNIYPQNNQNQSQYPQDPNKYPSNITPYQSNTFNINAQGHNNNYNSRVNDPNINPNHQPFSNNPYNNNNYNNGGDINSNNQNYSQYHPNIAPNAYQPNVPKHPHHVSLP